MSLDKLKEKYDRVIITHDKALGSRVVLVNGLKLHIGESRLHDNDSFNRRLGRTIAQGRAEFASKVSDGSSSGRKTELSFTVTCKDVKELDIEVSKYLPKNN